MSPRQAAGVCRAPRAGPPGRAAAAGLVVEHVAEIEPLHQQLEDVKRTVQSGYTDHTAHEAQLEKIRLAETEAEKALQSIALELNRRIEHLFAQSPGVWYFPKARR